MRDDPIMAKDEDDDRPAIPSSRVAMASPRGVDLTSNAAIWEILDDGAPLDKLR
jgi:hypothetical protein